MGRKRLLSTQSFSRNATLRLLAVRSRRPGRFPFARMWTAVQSFYFEGGGQTPKTMTEKLNLGEDFVFDAEDAFSQPESDSAKVLGSTIDGIVQNRLNKTLQGQKIENQKLAKETNFRNKHNLNDEEWSAFVDFAKSKSLELEDIYFLMNRKGRDEKIADNTRQEIQNKMREVQQTPGTLATQGSVQTEKSPDDSVFDAILGSTNELEKAFGI